MSLGIDTQPKVRIHVGKTIGYGYDFLEEIEGAPSKKMYENALEATKKAIYGESGEKFISAGIVDDRFGWYITTI